MNSRRDAFDTFMGLALLAYDAVLGLALLTIVGSAAALVLAFSIAVWRALVR